jgi:nitric oxide reductase subunit C
MLTKRQARLFFTGGTALFTGIFLLLSFDTHRQVPSQTHADKIDDHVRAGKQIWEKNNCMGCHTLFGEGAYYAPELTQVVERRGKEWIRVFLKNPEAMFPGQRKMVQYNFSEEEISQTIAFLEWCGNVDLNGFPAKPPLREALNAVQASYQKEIQPESSKESSVQVAPVPAIFTSASCTGCHQIQGQGGAAGALIGAPPLDDVYLRYTRDELEAWIKDPQKIKPDTKMPKLYGLVIDDAQVEEIIDYLLGLNPKANGAE